MDFRFKAQFFNHVLTLGQRMNMAVNGLNIFDFCAFNTQQRVLYRLKMLTDDMKFAIWHKTVNIGDPPGQRIIHGNHGHIGFSVTRSSKGLIKGLAGHSLRVREDLAAGKIGISASISLESNDFTHDLPLDFSLT
jgi:hypothetical protein